MKNRNYSRIQKRNTTTTLVPRISLLVGTKLWHITCGTHLLPRIGKQILRLCKSTRQVIDQCLRISRLRLRVCGRRVLTVGLYTASPLPCYAASPLPCHAASPLACHTASPLACHAATPDSARVSRGHFAAGTLRAMRRRLCHMLNGRRRRGLRFTRPLLIPVL